MNKLIRCNSQVSTVNLAIKKMHAGKVNHEDLYAEYYVIEGVSHMVIDSVMNEINYDKKSSVRLADELMKTNARIPAPLSHPTDEAGGFMDANDPITFLGHNIGAFDTDWRVNGDKLVSNTYIPVDAIENPKPQAEWLAERVKNQKPIDRSTGLYLEIDYNKSGVGRDGEPYTAEVVKVLELNHSALLDPSVEPGAKNSIEGIGMFTNKAGDKCDIEDIDLMVNASTPAMSLPLAPKGTPFDKESAMARIKDYTGSKDKPSTNYRKFFLEFDQGDADNFESYNGLFADIIGGVPHAVDEALNDYVDDKYAQAYRARFEKLYNNSDTGIIHKAINALKGLIVNDNEKGYNTSRGEHPCKPTNNEDSNMDRKKMQEMMKNAGMSYSDDMSDDDMMKKMNEAMKKGAMGDKADGTENMGGKESNMGGDGYQVGNAKSFTLEDITTAVNAAVDAKVKPLQDQINANANQKLESLADDVVSLDIGIDKDATKTMSANLLTSILAKNGHVGFNAAGSFNSNSDFSLTNMEAID